jgi:Domain of unknown function (DUF4189)
MNAHKPLVTWTVLLMGLALLLAVPHARAQFEGQGCYISGYDPDPYDSASQPIWECPGKGRTYPPEFQGTWYASIAKSDGSYSWGASWHHDSAASAERAALALCRKGNHNDCKVAITGANNCLSLAISVPDGAWATFSSDYDRSDAISKATRSCQHYGGKNCRVVVTPCGRSRPETPPCVQEYRNDISRGEAWKHMSPEEKKMWNRPSNGACH